MDLKLKCKTDVKAISNICSMLSAFKNIPFEMEKNKGKQKLFGMPKS